MFIIVIYIKLNNLFYFYDEFLVPSSIELITEKRMKSRNLQLEHSPFC